MAKKIEFDIVKNLGVLSETEKGFTKEINIVSWNDAPSKIDIRNWYPNHEKCGKGITLSDDESIKLLEALDRIYSSLKRTNLKY